ncbi:hypothetical protein GCM10027046_27510 [Uliginosibacterium flavum]
MAAATVVCFLLSQRFAQLWLFLIVPSLFGWLIAASVTCWRTRSHGKHFIGLIAVWICALVVGTQLRHWQETRIRAHAEQILAKTEDYMSKHGSCPKQAEDIGESREKLRRKWGIVYACGESVPMLAYMSLGNGFDRYYYDFKNKVWTFHPD